MSFTKLYFRADQSAKMAAVASDWTISTFFLTQLNTYRQNLTGSMCSTFSTKYVCFFSSRPVNNSVPWITCDDSKSKAWKAARQTNGRWTRSFQLLRCHHKTTAMVSDCLIVFMCMILGSLGSLFPFRSQTCGWHPCAQFRTNGNRDTVSKKVFKDLISAVLKNFVNAKKPDKICIFGGDSCLTYLHKICHLLIQLHCTTKFIVHWIWGDQVLTWYTWHV